MLPYQSEFLSNHLKNLMQPFPLPDDALSKLASWLLRYTTLKVWTEDDRWKPRHCHTNTMYLTWAFRSGELINLIKPVKPNTTKISAPLLFACNKVMVTPVKACVTNEH